MSCTRSDNTLFALVDCNSFFVSCERVFNPKLLKKPVVVLSSNDGCVISLSKEAKQMGIPMGAVFFQWAEFFKNHGVVACSANFSLYADLSTRVMQTIGHLCNEMEIYSIDECFLSLHELTEEEALEWAKKVRRTVMQWVGIPVSVGISSSKTLAKLANYHAKHTYYESGIFALSCNNEALLAKTPVDKVWGIGRRTEIFLKKHGIKSVLALRNAEEGWVKKHLSITGLRTVLELKGISCLEVEDAPAAKKSILCSRSFGRAVLKKEELAEALATHASSAAEKLRSQGSLANYMEIFIATSPHKENDSYYAPSMRLFFEEATDYTPHFISHAKMGLEQIFQPGLIYKKAGVMLFGIVPNQFLQQNLFHLQEGSAKKQLSEKRKSAMQLIDGANQKFGYDILQFAAEGTKKGWRMHQEHRSQAFTTSWDELLTITI